MGIFHDHDLISILTLLQSLTLISCILYLGGGSLRVGLSSPPPDSSKLCFKLLRHTYFTYLLYLLYLRHLLYCTCLWDLHHMLVCTLSVAICSYLEPSGAIWRCLELSVAIWNYLELSGAWSYLAPSGHLELSGAIFSYLGLSEAM